MYEDSVLCFVEVRKLEKAVKYFARLMRLKLIRKYYESNEMGWDKEESLENIINRFEHHVERVRAGDLSQALDVANLAMMLYLHGIKSKMIKRKEN